MRFIDLILSVMLLISASRVFSNCYLEHSVKRDKKTSQQNMSFDFIVRKHLQQA